MDPNQDTYLGEQDYVPATNRIDLSAPGPAQPLKMPEMNLENSYKILDFYQKNPQWLANPRTMHAANADFAQASKIIGMNMQLQRLSNSGEAAKTAQGLVRNNIKWAGEIVAAKPDAALPDGTPVSALFTPGDNGKMPIENPALTPYIATLHGQHVLPKPDRGNSIETAALYERQHLDAASKYDAEGNTQAADLERSLAQDQANYRRKLSVGLSPTPDQKAFDAAAMEAKKSDAAIQKQEAEVAALQAKLKNNRSAVRLYPDQADKLNMEANKNSAELAAATAKLNALKSHRSEPTNTPAVPSAQFKWVDGQLVPAK